MDPSCVENAIHPSTKWWSDCIFFLIFEVQDIVSWILALFSGKKTYLHFRNFLANEFINYCVYGIPFLKNRCSIYRKICKIATIEKQMLCIWEILKLEMYLSYLPILSIVCNLQIAIFMRKSITLLLLKHKKCYIYWKICKFAFSNLLNIYGIWEYLEKL